MTDVVIPSCSPSCGSNPSSGPSTAVSYLPGIPRYSKRKDHGHHPGAERQCRWPPTSLGIAARPFWLRARDSVGRPS